MKWSYLELVLPFFRSEDAAALLVVGGIEAGMASVSKARTSSACTKQIIKTQCLVSDFLSIHCSYVT